VGHISRVGASSNDRRDVLDLLESAHGYTVFDHAGRRVGTFIELAGASGQEIAIRHDAVFLWRRRLLPGSTVASVSPEHGTLVLTVDRRALDAMGTAPAPVDDRPDENRPFAQRDDDSTVPWHVRMERYLATDEPDSGAATVREGDERSTNTSARLSADTSETPATAADRYLLFVSTADGYRLVEQRGSAPAASDFVQVPEHDGLFWVAKLGHSPLPNDGRVCAYLERND
jgi:hypothetical protein